MYRNRFVKSDPRKVVIDHRDELNRLAEETRERITVAQNTLDREREELASLVEQIASFDDYISSHAEPDDAD